MKFINLNIFRTIKFFLITAFSLSILLSCRKNVDDEAVNEGFSTVQFNVQGVTFETPDTDNLIRMPKVTASNIVSTKAVGNGMMLQTELSVDTARYKSIKQRSGTINKLAATQTDNLDWYGQYRVYVFDENGNYMQEYIFTNRTESPTGNIRLQNFKTYTFVAISINSSSSCPSLEFANPNAKTLNTAKFRFKGYEDVLYYQESIKIVNTQTILPIVFKHLSTGIEFTLSTYHTGYYLKNYKALLRPMMTTADFKLSDRSITLVDSISNYNFSQGKGIADTLFKHPLPLRIYTGLNSPAKLWFESLVFNTGGRAETGTFEIKNFAAIDNLQLLPGVLYKIKLTLIPQDSLLTHKGLLAAKINGKIWMRHNLGANYQLDPDVNMNSGLHGGFYQWGNRYPFALGNSTLSASERPTAWSSTALGIASLWNKGTSTVPVKGTDDPCPTGYRIPTNQELGDLIDNTLTSATGPWTGSVENSDFTSAKVLTSKRNKSVKLTFPAQGYYDAKFDVNSAQYQFMGITDRSVLTRLWSSNYLDTYRYSSLLLYKNTFDFYQTTGMVDGIKGQNIRCIAE